jgi:FK506-binding nuclear protein
MSKSEKKKAKKLKAADGSAVAPPETNDKAKPQDTQSSEQKKKESGPDDQKKKEGSKNVAKEVKLPSGLIYTDAKVGTGDAAKKNDVLQVRYIGKLASNGKMFDSNTKGAPFSFKLGKGQVIQGLTLSLDFFCSSDLLLGWDEGMAGMKVGGERSLKVPAKLGYGKQGSAPEIGPNADLIFGQFSDSPGISPLLILSRGETPQYQKEELSPPVTHSSHMPTNVHLLLGDMMSCEIQFSNFTHLQPHQS